MVFKSKYLYLIILLVSISIKNSELILLNFEVFKSDNISFFEYYIKCFKKIIPLA